MERSDIEALKARVPCMAVLDEAGFAIDMKESTRRARKYRRGDDIIIVIHDGKGWFDPRSDAKGDVFTLVDYLEKMPFADVLHRVTGLVGFVSQEPTWIRTMWPQASIASVGERWRKRRVPWPGSATWRYLCGHRDVPELIIRAAMQHDLLREGPFGSMWAAHLDRAGLVIGWEERGAAWRGFTTGGAKELFRLGAVGAPRLCVTEAAIDAMSLAALESLRPDTLYLSTGGGWAPATERAIRALLANPGTHLVAATDNNSQGEAYARRLAVIAVEANRGWQRLRPVSIDWNEDLRATMREREKRRENIAGGQDGIWGGAKKGGK